MASAIALPMIKDAKGIWSPRDLTQQVKSSIQLILGTIPGERPHLPEFGSRLHELIFEPATDVLVALARRWTIEAILRWEPRVTLLGVQIEIENENFRIIPDFVINGDPNREKRDLVFPLRRL